MRTTLSMSILAASFISGGFSEEIATELNTTDFAFQQEHAEFDANPTSQELNWDRYVSVSISGLAARTVDFEIGNWKQTGNNSFLMVFKQSISKSHYWISSAVFYQRHFNPFDYFAFYAGLGLDSGFFFKRNDPFALLVTPTLSLGKIISSSKENKQFLELRTILGHYYDYISYPNAYGLASRKLNYQIHYGMTF